MHTTVKLDEHMPAWGQSKCIYNENSPLFYHCCAASQYENTDHRSAKIRFYRQTHQRLQTWFIHAAHESFNKGFAFLLHEKWFQWSFKYTHGCVFYLQSPQCWNHNHVNTYDSKIAKQTHLKTTEMRGQGSSITANVWILMSVQYLCITLALSFLIYLQRL